MWKFLYGSQNPLSYLSLKSEIRSEKKGNPKRSFSYKMLVSGKGKLYVFERDRISFLVRIPHLKTICYGFSKKKKKKKKPFAITALHNCSALKLGLAKSKEETLSSLNPR